jgi:excisionase family DNA binding protein
MQNVSTLPEVPAMKQAERQYYTVAEAAGVLDVSPSTVWRWIKAKKLPAYRVGERAIRIRKDDLAAIIQPLQAADMAMEKAQAPTQAELARRHALVAKMRQARQARGIAPLTSADLVRMAREEEHQSYAPGR